MDNKKIELGTEGARIAVLSDRVVSWEAGGFTRQLSLNLDGLTVQINVPPVEGGVTRFGWEATPAEWREMDPPVKADKVWFVAFSERGRPLARISGSWRLLPPREGAEKAPHRLVAEEGAALEFSGVYEPEIKTPAEIIPLEG